MGGRDSAGAARLPADERGVPLDGPVAGRVSADERRIHSAGRAARDAEAGLSGPSRVLSDPLRARDRILREPGAAGPAGGDSGFHLVDL